MSEKTNTQLNRDFISLKEYVDQRLLDKDKAIDIAQENSDKWRANANEWREAMNDRERQFLTRREFYSILVTGVAVIGLILGLARI